MEKCGRLNDVSLRDVEDLKNAWSLDSRDTLNT